MRLGCAWWPSPGGPALLWGGACFLTDVDFLAGFNVNRVVRFGPPYVWSIRRAPYSTDDAIRVAMRLGCAWWPCPGGPALLWGGARFLPDVDVLGGSDADKMVRFGPPYVWSIRRCRIQPTTLPPVLRCGWVARTGTRSANAGDHCGFVRTRGTPHENRSFAASGTARLWRLFRTAISISSKVISVVNAPAFAPGVAY